SGAWSTTSRAAASCAGGTMTWTGDMSPTLRLKAWSRWVSTMAGMSASPRRSRTRSASKSVPQEKTAIQPSYSLGSDMLGGVGGEGGCGRGRDREGVPVGAGDGLAPPAEEDEHAHRRSEAEEAKIPRH